MYNSKMKNLFIHGCFDLTTLRLLKNYGVENFAFDLRGRSSQLITIDSLHACLRELGESEVELIFENDSHQTVESYLDLLKMYPINFYPQFRCYQSVEYYAKIDRPWTWVFHPEGNWKEILNLPYLKKLILPLKWRRLYQTLPELWTLVDYRNIEVILQVSTFEEIFSMAHTENLLVGLDLDNSVQKSYRVIDFDKLKRLQILEGVL